VTKRLERAAALLAALTALALALTLPALASIGGEAPEPPTLATRLFASPDPLSSPGKGLLKLEIKVPAGYHIFSDSTLAVRLPALQGVTAGKSVVPKGTMEEDRPVLRGTVIVEVPVVLSQGAPAVLKGAAELDWQACQEFGDKVCFLPATDKVPFEIKTARGEAGAAPAGPAAGEEKPPASGGPPPERGATASEEPPAQLPPGASGVTPPAGTGYEARFATAAKENVPLALLLAFLFGVLSSLTPCVYPVIPITVAYIGSRAEGKGKAAGFFLSLAFVAGLALVYAALGAVSAKAGQAFGSLTQTPWVGLPIAALFFVLSLSMFNLFELKTPAALTNRIERTKQKGKGRGYAGAVLIGALSGLVASPCIGPLLLAILVVVAATGSALLGFVYLFAFALGMGVLFMVIGTFSGVLSSLPKSGGWMDGVRVLFGSLILGAAFYFAGLYLPRPAFLAASLVALWIVVLYLLFGGRRHLFSMATRLAGILLSAAALALVFLSLAPAGGKGWRSDLGPSLELARQEGKPLLLDFRADWCVACVELEKETWTDPRVRTALGELIPVRLDMTRASDEGQALLRRFRVMGLPTVILLDPQGKELGRFVGFKEPEDFLAWRDRAASAQARPEG
jgi:thiol:disulfide interchange protein DsbD